ncbi:MAG: CvpA family protein [Fibrobacter sp.]|nr:CvpA family protein [Fibrobacter sp.]
MNTIDIVSLALMTLLALIGVWHGLLRGIFRLIAWASAVIGAYLTNAHFANTVVENLGCSNFSATIVCLCIGFLVPFLLFLFIGHVINRAVSDTVVNKFDRILGALFGVVKAVLILFALLTIMHVLPFGGVIKETRDTAVAYKLYQSTLESLGYSSDPIDLVDVAEKKATEFTKNITDKAAEKASEVASEAASRAATAAKDAADKALEEAKDAAKAAVDQTQKKAADAALNKKDSAESAKADTTRKN